LGTGGKNVQESSRARCLANFKLQLLKTIEIKTIEIKTIEMKLFGSNQFSLLYKIYDGCNS
jgi:hypothetical protein